MNVTFLVATPKTADEYFASNEGILLKNVYKTKAESTNIEIVVAAENKDGIPKLCNKYVSEFYKNDCDYMIFLHDDVEIHDSMVTQKLIKAHEKYDVVGLAGAVEMVDKNPQEPIWLQFGGGWRGKNSGFVAHRNKQTGQINSAFYGYTPSGVIMIDGLFMSINVKKAVQNNVSFDEDFKFHFYDSSFCFRARDAGLSIGTHPIFVIHNSGGSMNDEWQKNKPLFLEKYIT